MAEDIKDLIAKIHEEGVKAAEDRAKEIEEKAKKIAATIVNDAKHKAEDIIRDAKADAKKIEDSGYASLRQAGRDILISLRKEINAMLSRITAARIKEALKPGEMAKLICAMIKEEAKALPKDIIISMSPKSADELKQHLMAELAEEIKKGVTLKRADEITGGFRISYDAGNSYYDFTDKSLAAHMSFRMNQKLKELLNG